MSRVIVHDQPPPGPAPRPPMPGQWRENWRGFSQWGRLALASRSLARQPRGSGGRVVLIPGWLAPEWSMDPVRRYLRFLGHDAVHWGLGRNQGAPERDRDVLAARIEAFGEPVSLVGWSLGGVIAREVARVLPDRVRQVVTYGTPVVGGPSFTLGAAAFGPTYCRRIARLLAEADRDDPIRVPIGAVFSKRDAVVHWTASIDRMSPDVVHYEVTTSHVTLGIDPDVWRIVARRVAGER